MLAQVLHSQQPIEALPLQLIEVPKPTPAPHELLVRVSACGVCRTDLHVIEGDLAPKQLPLIPGHQVVGIVEELGAKCSKFKLGERVGIAWLRHTCESCAWCQSGSENLCDSSLYTGYHTNGGFAEFAVIDENYAYRIPDKFSDAEAAPLLCAGIIGFRALKRSNCAPGSTLGFFGFGSSAHIALQVALSWGCEVFVSTRTQAHQVLARKLGASWVGDSNQNMPKKLSSAVIFAPAGSVVPEALRALDKGGTAAIAGIYLSPIPELDYESCLFHEKKLVSVESNTREDGENLLKAAEQISIKVMTESYSLAEANSALLKLKQGGIQGTAVLHLD